MTRKARRKRNEVTTPHDPQENKVRILAEKIESLYNQGPLSNKREELESLLKEALEEAIQDAYIAGCNESVLQFKNDERNCKAATYEECAQILEEDVLLTPDEFEGKTKLKVFNLLEKVACLIRSRAKELADAHDGEGK